MVKRNVLEKMSDKELLQYLRSDSRFVVQALEIAFDILKKRNHQFTTFEEERINQLIEAKRNDEREQDLKRTWDVGEDAEKGSVSFYSQTAIWVLGILFGTLVGAILLAINLFKISKSKKALFVLVFGIIYVYALYIIYQLTQFYFNHFLTQIIAIALNVIGVVVLQVYFWKKYLLGVIYKKRDATVPLIVSIAFFIVLYVLNRLLQDSVGTELIYQLN